MSKKKIKIITYGNFPYGGAAANFLRDLAVGLSKNNCDVEVLLPKGNYFGKKIEQSVNRTGNVNNVRYRFFCFTRHPVAKIGKVIDNFFGPSFLFFYIIYKYLSGDIEYILKYNISFSSQILLLIIAKVFKIKLINIIPEFFQKPKSGIINSAKWYNFYFGLQYLVEFSSGIIVLTKYLKNYISKLNGTVPILIQPNLVDPELFKNDTNSSIHNKITIGYSGTPTIKDGILDLLNSFKIVLKSVSDVKLLVIGDITNGKSVIPELIKYCKQIGIENYVDFTGLVPFDRIPSLLNSCDILVLTRPHGVFAEAGFPTKLGEYFSTSKPVVVTKVGDMEHYFSRTNSVVLVEAEDVDDISTGIVSLIRDPARRIELGKAGYIWMSQYLEYIQASKKINDFLSDL